jgi:hypothetical protein
MRLHTRNRQTHDGLSPDYFFLDATPNRQTVLDFFDRRNNFKTRNLFQ